MKTFRSIIVVVLLALAALVVTSVFVPRVDAEFTTSDDRQPAVCFVSMLNIQAMPDWVEGLERVERKSGILAEPGSSFQLYFSGSETSGLYTMELLDVKPMSEVKVVVSNDMLEMLMTQQFEKALNGTVLRTSMQLRGRSFLARAFIPFFKTVIVDEMKQNMENFCERKETE